MRPLRFRPFIGSLLLAISPVVAHATAPGSPPAGGTTGGMGWLWVILLLVVIGAAVWYFGFARNRSRTTSGMGVDRDRVAGSAEQAKGSIKEGVGSVIGDTKLQAEGRMDKAEGKAQNTVGGIKDTLRGK